MAEEVSEQTPESSQSAAPEEERVEQPATEETSTQENSSSQEITKKEEAELEQKEPAPEEKPVQDAPLESEKQEEPEPTPEESSEKPPEEKNPLPQEIQELDDILKELHALTKACEKVLEQTATLEDQDEAQKAVAAYTKALSHLPTALQLLNDFRRHEKRLGQEAAALQKQLAQLRQDKDALSSEEARVILETTTVKDTVLGVIFSLEHALLHVRNTAHPLLSLVSYDRPGFKEFALNILRQVRIDFVSSACHEQHARLSILRKDLTGLHDLQAHAEQLQNVSTSS